jgi:hypothetical protein
MRRTRYVHLILTAGLVLGAAAKASSVLVAPHHIFIDHRVRSASIQLFNAGDQTEEVSIETLFGYPATDSLGRVYLYTDSTEASAESQHRSAARWIRAFPRRVTVRPGQRQTVRLLAQPPSDLPDGEYWTRVVVHAKGQRVPLAGIPDSSSIQVGLDLEVRTVIALTYRKGEVSTGIRLSRVAPRIVGDTLYARPLLERDGEAAYIGVLHTELVDSTGEVVRQWEEQIAVYESLHRQLRYPVADLAPGPYTVRISASTDRTDIQPPNLLVAAPVRDSAVVVR